VVGAGRIKVMVRFCGSSLEEGLKSEGAYVVVVGGGVGRVSSARAAVGPDAGRSPRKEGSRGRWKRIDGSGDRKRVPCMTS
jgi:hypothetical protein